MKVISEASESVLTMLKRFFKNDSYVCWSQYCVHTPIEDGVLVFNLLTREFIFLTLEEYESFSDLEYLREHWFVIPKSIKEKEIADFVKWVLFSRQPKPTEITSYTIFATTDCNARCFYCFELGRSRIPMSCQTAEKVVQYIKTHCGGKSVKIGWFGGEPLFNLEAIDTIAAGLHREGIKFTSKMVSNGYLFDDEIVHKAVESWNLRKVQITLDGTEKVYNKIKAFIYRDSNPYDIVMNNIERLITAGIRVIIRLNMDLYNAENLLALTEELSQRFSNKKGLFVYAHHLLDFTGSDTKSDSNAEWEKREIAMQRLNKRIDESGLGFKGGVSKKIKNSFCMADNGKAVTILPNGDIGLCEHYTESEFIGHIDQKDFDVGVVTSWRERMPEIPECAGCFYYMDCVMLKKCPNGNSCNRQFRHEQMRNIQRAMLCEYERWQSKTNTEDDEGDNFC